MLPLTDIHSVLRHHQPQCRLLLTRIYLKIRLYLFYTILRRYITLVILSILLFFFLLPIQIRLTILRQRGNLHNCESNNWVSFCKKNIQYSWNKTEFYNNDINTNQFNWLKFENKMGHVRLQFILQLVKRKHISAV